MGEPVRPTMVDLIARVRDLIGDPAQPTGGGSPLFADAQIQDWLDDGYQFIQYEVLEPIPTLTPTGIVWEWYVSQWQHWEQSPTLIWNNYTTLTPIEQHLILGKFRFTNQLPAVLISGTVYDVWRVAANLLEMRIAQQALTQLDFTADGHNIQLGKGLDRLAALVKTYRRRAWPRPLSIVRTEIQDAPGYSERAARVGPVSAGVPFLTGP